MVFKNIPKWVLLLFIVPVFAGIIVFRFTHAPSATRASSNSTARISNTSDPNCAEVESASQGEEAKSNAMNDNSFQQSGSDSPDGPLHIEAIVISASGKSNIFVNGQYSSEGDTINGYKVFKIYTDKADFEKNGKITTAYLSLP